MQKSKILLIATACVLATPGSGYAHEAVLFSFTKGELATSDTRELLLERIEKHSRKSCKKGSSLATIEAVKRCTKDLKQQFVRAIDDDALTLLASTDGQRRVRTARR